MEEIFVGENEREIARFKRRISIKILMRWVDPNQQWFMYNASNDKFIMNFFDCENITRLFPKMEKCKENKYELMITETSE